MKQFNQKNQIWFKQNDGVVQVGFTKSFLDGLDQCWHIVPANNQRFREKAPLMVVETNDALISIMSPVSANFVEWNNKAQDFPDQLTEDDVILTMTTQRVEARPQIRGRMLDLAVADEGVAGALDPQRWEPQQFEVRVNGNVAGGRQFGAAPARPLRAEMLRQLQEQQEVVRRAEAGEF